MPIQAPQWTDYLNCPVCCRKFGAQPRSPISLGCGHTLCRHCLKHLNRKQCPFDQTDIQVEPEEFVVNTALLQLAGYTPPVQPYHPPTIQALPEQERQAYDIIVRCMEHLSICLKYHGNVTNNNAASRLSRPMQRKLVTLLQCSITDEDGRGRTARAVRSLAERTVTEFILQHQNPQQLSANLWAAVRARGCQFLGPAMQEEVLKLVLLTLEDGSALSRKVLVMFVVQRLEPHFPQASKTSIGHVVQLLYRASCFKVSKRESDSSLMQLKEEFRTYNSLRREHDTQIVQIATEAGLRIAPDQWSALLYGDTQHKSHMQSIIDKLQTPQTFVQSVQELFITLQRTGGDPEQLILLTIHLERLTNIDPSPDAKSPTWPELAEIMTSLKVVITSLTQYLEQAICDTNQNPKHLERPESATSQRSLQNPSSPPTHHKYKVSMCRDAATRSYCPRGATCTFAHSEEELEKYRSLRTSNGNFTLLSPVPQAVPLPSPQAIQLPRILAWYPRSQPLHVNNYNLQPITSMPPSHPNMLTKTEHVDNHLVHVHNVDALPQHFVYNRTQAAFNHGDIIIPLPERLYYSRFGTMHPIPEEQGNMQYPTEFQGLVYQGFVQGPPTMSQNPEEISEPLPNMLLPVQHELRRNVSPYPIDDQPSKLQPDYRVKSHDASAASFASVPRDISPDPTWHPANEAFNFDGIRTALPESSCDAEDQELEEELQALERRIDTEFKSAD